MGYKRSHCDGLYVKASPSLLRELKAINKRLKDFDIIGQEVEKMNKSSAQSKQQKKVGIPDFSAAAIKRAKSTKISPKLFAAIKYVKAEAKQAVE
jgi:hypothetical protein